MLTQVRFLEGVLRCASSSVAHEESLSSTEMAGSGVFNG